MHATEILKEEHAVIERVLNLLTKAIERIDRHFADHCHHGTRKRTCCFRCWNSGALPPKAGR